MSAPAPALPRTILVVEDEASIADAVATRLRSEGYAVEIAADGPAGVERCERLQPDLVVLDLMLPGLDGLEVCREIQRDRPVPVLMLTARDSETDLLVGLGGRRRRLPDQAVQRPRARRPGPRAAAAGRAPARADRRARSRLGAVTIDLDVAPRAQRRRARAPHADRVRPARLPRRAARPGVHPRGAARARCGATTTASGARTVDSHVRALRRKLGADVVRTVHGVGYAAGGKPPRDPPRTTRRTRSTTPVAQAQARRSSSSAAVAVTVVVFWVGLKLGRVAVGERHHRRGRRAGRSCGSSSRGMTSPLREMAAAASEMAKGDYDRRVTATSHDEVGTLARAFNQMAAELAETDRVRRDLVANVSPRAAHADHRAAGGAREPRRRRRRARSRDVPHDARPGRAARPAGQAAARPLPARVGRGPARPHRSSAVEPLLDARGARAAAARAATIAVVGARSTRPTSPPTATPSACTRSSPTCSRTRCATRRRGGTVEVRARRTRRRRRHRGARRRPRHPRRRRRPASSNASTAPTPPARRATAAPASASPSPGGSSTCTAATSIPNGASRTAAAWSSPCPHA